MNKLYVFFTVLLSSFQIVNAQHCIPSTVDCNTNQSYITQVRIAKVVGVNDLYEYNSPTSTCDSGYVDRTTTQGVIPVVTAGTQVTVQITFVHSPGANAAAPPTTNVWVDWNQNGVFEQTELTYAIHSNTTFNVNGIGTSSLTLPVPADASAGKPRLRVKFVGSTAPAEIGILQDPCDNTGGETEDFLVEVENLTVPECAQNPNPTDGGTDVCNSGSTLSFDPPAAAATPAQDPTGYELSLWTDNGSINYVVQDSNIGANTVFNIPVELTPGETYYWQVSPYNDFGTNGSCDVWSFVTAPVPNPVPVIDVDGFNGDTAKVCADLDAQVNLTDANSTSYTGATYDWDGTATNSFPLSDTTVANPIFNSNISDTTFTLSVVVTDQYGCTGTDTINVYVKERATPGSISAANTKVCDGETTDLTLSGFVGDIEWFSSTTSATSGYSTRGDFDSLHTTAPILQDVFYAVIVTLDGCADTSSIFLEKKDLPFKPVIVAGQTVFCEGDSLGLTAAWPDPGTLMWDDVNNTQGIEVFIKETGTYTVTGTGLNNCSNTSNPVMITKIAKPAAPAVSEFFGTPCVGDSVGIDVFLSGDSIDWIVNGNVSDVFDADTQLYVFNSASYQFVARTDEGCLSDTTFYNTSFNTYPVKPVINQLSNDSLEVIGEAGVFMWYTVDGTLVATETDSIFEPTANGTYFVVASNGPCESEPSDTIVVDLLSTIQTNGVEQSLVRVYPNPSSGQITLELTEESVIELYDLSGKIILRTNFPKGKNKLSLAQQSGIYILKVNDQMHQRLIIK